jgi:hypothetical protein
MNPNSNPDANPNAKPTHNLNANTNPSLNTNKDLIEKERVRMIKEADYEMIMLKLKAEENRLKG